jgi:hypothetical protein
MERKKENDVNEYFSFYFVQIEVEYLGSFPIS